MDLSSAIACFRATHALQDTAPSMIVLAPRNSNCTAGADPRHEQEPAGWYDRRHPRSDQRTGAVERLVQVTVTITETRASQIAFINGQGGEAEFVSPMDATRRAVLLFGN